MATEISHAGNKPGCAFVRVRRSLVFTLAAILLLYGCKGGQSEQEHTSSGTQPNTEELVSPTPGNPPGPTAFEKFTDAQRVIVFAAVEEPCSQGEISGGSVRSLHLTFVGVDLPGTRVGAEPQVIPELEPAVPGRWRWSGRSELTFTPDADWSARTYRLSVPDGVLPSNYALFTNQLWFNAHPSCIDPKNFKKPYDITAPKLPKRPTDAAPDQLLIAFDRPVAEIGRVQQKFTEEASLEPSLRGEWFWQSEKVLVFQPGENWKPGTNYVVRLKPAVFAKSAVIPGYEYRFSTPQSQTEQARSRYYLSAPGLPEWDEKIKPQELTLTFYEPVAPTHLIDKPLPDATLTPAIQGEFRWADDKKLVFRPTEHWRPSTLYRLTYSSRIFGDTAGERTHIHDFDTPMFKANITAREFYIDPSNPSVKRVTAGVRFSHPVDRTEFERHVSLELKPQARKTFADGPASKPFGFKVNWDKFGKEAYITSDPVTLPEDDAQMEITISAGVHSTLPVGRTTPTERATVYVPGARNYFRVESVAYSSAENKSRGLDQLLVIQLSTAVKSDNAGKISALLLPEFHEEKPEDKIEPDKWEDLSEVTPAVLERSTPVTLTEIPAPAEFSKQISFKFHAEAGRSLLVTVPAGLESQDGYTLGAQLKQLVYVGRLPRTIKLLSTGSLLSLTGEKKLSLMTRGVKTVEITASRLLPGTIAHLVSQTEGAINNPYFVGYKFGEDDIVERFVEKRDVHSESGETKYSAIDVGQLLNKQGAPPRGLFLFTIADISDRAGNAAAADSQHEQFEGNSEGYAYYQSATMEKRLVLVTDIGPLAKINQDGSREVFIHSLSRQRPVENATVKVIGRNGLPVVIRTTGAEGRAVFPKLSDFTREREPAAYVVEKDGDLSFMPYERSDRRLNLSRFDVGGLQTQTDLPGIQAFLFSDRGIYRPGDEMHFGLVIKPDNWAQDISAIPLEAVLTDPRGLEIRKEKVRFGKEGFEEFSHTSQESSPTGSYQLTLYVVKDNKRASALGSTSARVEEFLPDRMTMNAVFSQKDRKGWLDPGGLKADISLMNLFGTPASSRRVTAAMTLTPAIPEFKEYSGFSFTDPLRGKSDFEDKLQPQTTDKDGRTSFDLNLGRYAKATYRLTVLAQGFEADGGRFVSASVGAVVSPLDYLIGFNPHGDLSYLRKDADQHVEFIAINPALEKRAVGGLKLKLVELRWVSVLTKQPNDTYAYESVLKQEPVREEQLSIPADGLSVKLETQKPGSFALIVQDADGLELNRAAYTVTGDGNIPVSREGLGEVEVKLDREEYLPGDTIELNIRAPYTGSGLITIEKERVYGFVWFKTNTTSSTQHIRIPEGFDGNGYVNVSFVRALDSKEVFQSPLSYGVQPFRISPRPRTNLLSLSTPDLVKPGQQLAFKLRAEKPARAAIFLVDEGILQVARYRTPDPLGHFYRKRALEVDTMQMLDLLIAEYSILREMSAAGGDEDLLSKHLNPFKRKRAKPVVQWFGLVDAGPEERQFIYDVPDYFNGSIRVMAVAVSEKFIGTAEARTTVRGDFVITPNVPSAVAPGDEFEVSTGVQNSLAGSGDNAQVTVGLRVNDGLELLSPAEVKMPIAEGSEAVARYTLRARERLGSAELKFSAGIGSSTATLAYDTSVRPASPLRTTLQAGASLGGVSEVPIKRRDIYEFGRTFEGSVSPLPLGYGQGLVRYLERYPYGCSEQLTSQANSALFLYSHPELGVIEKKKVEETLRRVLRTLASRQNPDGSISTWYPGGAGSDEINNYIALFLLEARERGFSVPVNLFNDLMRHLRAIANNPPRQLYEARNAAFAAYLLTRNGVVTTQYLTGIRGWLDNYEKNRPQIRPGTPYESWRKDLSAVYLAAAYKLLKDDAQANAAINEAGLVEPVVPDYFHYYDRLIHGSVYLYVASRHFPDRVQGIAPQTILNFLQPLADGYFNTLSSSYALLALDSYMKAVKDGSLGTFAVSLLGPKNPSGAADEQVLSFAPNELFPKFTVGEAAEKLKLQSSGILYYQLYQEGYDRTLPTEALSRGLEVYRELRSEDGQPITETRLGDKLTVVLRLRALGREPIANIAVVDMLPGGFEVEMSGSRFAPVSAGSGDGDGTGTGGAQESVFGFGLPGGTFAPDYADVREDRVLLFGTVPTSQAVEFRYRLTPTNKGTFIVPPVYGEAMYDRSITAVFPGGRIKTDGPAEVKP